MRARQLAWIALAAVIGFGVGLFSRSPNSHHDRSAITSLREITVSQPVKDGFGRIETRLRVDRMTDPAGRKVWENNRPEDDNKPAWKLMLSGFSIYATPD